MDALAAPLLARRGTLRALLFTLAALHFAWGLPRREISVLEAQDFGLAVNLFRDYALSPDHSPLHFVFENSWQRLDATSVSFLRLPSVVFCALAVVVVFSLAERIAGRRAGLVAAAFLATNPLVVDNARSMRMYALAVLLAACVLWLTHAYLVVARRNAYLFGLALASLAAIYNHLFAWLLIGSVAALLVVDAIAVKRADRGRLAKWAVIVGVALLPQAIHVVVAVRFTSERHALYRGVGSDETFLTSIGRTLFCGEDAPVLPLAPVFIALCVALVALGAIGWTKYGPRAALAVFAPAFLVAWLLSFSNPVEPRYLNYLVPAIAVFIGIGASRGWRLALVAPAIAFSCFATDRSYDGEPTDWYEAATRIAGTAPDVSRSARPEVVAIFPGFWEPSFRRYAALGETVPITFPADLDRVLARGERFRLVVLPGRELGSLDAVVHAHARSELLFETKIRDHVSVYSIAPQVVPSRPAPAAGSMLLVGTVGSGGYPWQGRGGAHPFELLHQESANATVIAGYEPYAPSWLARRLIGGDAAALLEPNRDVASALAEAGVHAVVLTRPDDPARAVLAAANIDILNMRSYDVGGVRVATLALMDPSVPSSAVEAAVVRVKTEAGPDGRTVVFVAASADYGRLATEEERARGHRLVDLGVDVVAGIGGYAAKEVERYRAGVIAYSLGALLRPSRLTLAGQDSTGIGLNLRFPQGLPMAVDVLPLTFDDRSEVKLALATSTRRIAPTSWLGDHIATASAFATSEDGAQHDLGAWEPARATFGSATAARAFELARPITCWFPTTLPDSPLRPFAGSFQRDRAYVGRRGVLDLGDFRRAIELDPAGVAEVGIRFREVPMREALSVAFGLPDDRLRSKFAALHDQTVRVLVGGREVLRETLSYRVGFRRREIDTRSVAGTLQDIQVSVHSNGTHFPVGVDAHIGTGD